MLIAFPNWTGIGSKCSCRSAQKDRLLTVQDQIYGFFAGGLNRDDNGDSGFMREVARLRPKRRTGPGGCRLASTQGTSRSVGQSIGVAGAGLIIVASMVVGLDPSSGDRYGGIRPDPGFPPASVLSPR